MNRLFLVSAFCVFIVGMVFVFPGIYASDAEGEVDQDNKTYRDQHYRELVRIKSHSAGAFSACVLHIECEMINPDFPAGRNTTLWKSVYFPKVDEFTELRNHFTQALVSIPDVSVRVWIEFPAFEIRSESRLLLYTFNETRSLEKEILVGSRAITVVMDQGIVTDMFWDDSCSFCSEKDCVEGSCSTVISEILPPCHNQDALAEDPYRCGIKLYVAWKGTDNNNQTLHSYTSVPSRFQKYSFIASAYDAAAGFTTDFLTFWKQPLN